MARSSQIAVHNRRADIEQALIEGQPIVKIADEFGVSAESLYRWQSSHVAPKLQEAMRHSETHSTTRLMDRLTGIADDHARARRVLMEAGAITQAVRAGDAEARALVVLMDRLGVDSSDTLEQLREGEAIARAVGRFTREDPDAGRRLAAHIRELGQPETAAALEALATSVSKKEIAP